MVTSINLSTNSSVLSPKRLPKHIEVLPQVLYKEQVFQSRLILSAIAVSIISFTIFATGGIILAASLSGLGAFVPLATVLPVVLLPVAVHFISKLFKHRNEDILPKVKYYEAVCVEFNKLPKTAPDIKNLLISLKLASSEKAAETIYQRYDHIDQIRTVLAYYLAAKTLLAKTADKVKNLEHDILNFPKTAQLFVENFFKKPTDSGYIEDLQIEHIPIKILKWICPYLAKKDKETALKRLETITCEAGHKELCENILKDTSPARELTAQERKFKLHQINNQVTKGARHQLHAAFFQVLLHNPQTLNDIDSLVQWNSHNLAEVFTSYYMNHQMSQNLAGSLSYDLYTMPKTGAKWSDFWDTNIKQNSLQGFSNSMLTPQAISQIAKAIKAESNA